LRTERRGNEVESSYLKEELTEEISKYGYMGSENPVMHSLVINEAWENERLDLDVSERGVIGRGCSVERDGRRIGVGVVGWQ
jgi:hypothetical protein